MLFSGAKLAFPYQTVNKKGYFCTKMQVYMIQFCILLQ